MTTVDFIFDFASPNAYLSHHAIPGIEERTGAKFKYIPCLLGGIFKATGNQAPMIAFAGIKGKLEYDRLEMERFIKKHNITFNMNPHFPVNTLTIARGAIAAEIEGQLTEYIEAVLGHMWREPKKMDDPEVIVSALDASGFDGEAILEKTQDSAVKAKLVENTEAAVARGAFGIPTFYVGDEMFYGKDRLGQVEEEIKQQS